MYYLSKDCAVCRAGCYWIILSTARDRYLCIEQVRLSMIGDRLAGWQDDRPLPTHPAPVARVVRLVGSLVSKGIITDDPSIGKPFVECRYPTPETCLDVSQAADRGNVSFFRRMRFFLACASADWRLRHAALQRTLTQIERRRLRAGSSIADRTPECVPRLVAAFIALRPLYPRPYLCLFDSLALLEFLARHGCFPRMVFGVIADPFQAHCWLQDGATVLGDDLERVRRYRPILSV
jgi:hypothetical protein